MVAALIGVSALVACNSIEVTMPVGPKGEQGIQGLPGKDGLSAYELWVKAVQEKQIDYTGPVDISHFFLYLKGKDGVDGKNGLDGKDGKDGANGVDGKSAYELWKEYVASGVSDPHNPGKQWDKSKTSMADFYWFLTGDDGADGLIPYIKDGNWWIGDTDTGVKARGDKGDTGAKGDKGDKGDTGISGKNGVDGQSAYEMWKQYVRETIEAGGKVTDQNGNEITLSDLSIQRFFQYLTGKAGSKGDKGDAGSDGKDGLDGKDGADGKDGKDGKDGADGKNGIDGKDGENGKDGDTPYVGSNGNWWIGDVDTGVKAQGQKGDSGAPGADGKDGKDGLDGKDGVDGKDGADGKDGTDGKDGSAGKSAYELWVADVRSGSGLEDPKNPGAKWDPTRTSVADFYEYLRGASGVDGRDGADGKDGVDGKDGLNGSDGKDGIDGQSAYGLWKELVLSEEGLDNPGNGVYDLETYPKWPKTAVSPNDFMDYLRGSSGESETRISVVDTLYVEEADWGKYNVAPVRSLVKVCLKGAERDTTYEYVNPYSGGCALIVSGPGPVAIPDCKVVFKDQAGNSYTKTSDAMGYIYLTRDELPVWNAASPSMSDISSRTKPISFSFGDKIITDQEKIAATCGVPYQVDVDVRMTGASWRGLTVYADYEIVRTVEGTEEKSWGGQKFPEGRKGLGYYMYRSLGDMDRFLKVKSYGFGNSPADYIEGDHFLRFGKGSVVSEWSRAFGTKESSTFRQLNYGDGKSPTVVSVNYLPKLKPYSDLSPDYGLMCVSKSKVMIPEYCYVGDLDVSGVRSGSGDELYTSYNGKKVLSGDGSSKVVVNRTNYELILGQTSFSFAFDYSTFGHVYLKKSYYDAGTDTYRFKRYATLQAYLSDTRLTGSYSYASSLSNSGTLSGVSISNSVSIKFAVEGGVIKPADNGSFIIRNVYDGFSMEVSDYSFEDIYYKGIKGKFQYDESDPYVASCELNGKKYVFQTIKDARSEPLK